MSGDARPATLRLDAWLWRARFFKTRTASAGFVSARGVRIVRDGATGRVDKPSAAVRVGDRLVFQIGPRLHVVDIEALPGRRGPAVEARACYEDRSPPPDPRPPADRAGPRPTKKDRRTLDAAASKDVEWRTGSTD